MSENAHDAGKEPSHAPGADFRGHTSLRSRARWRLMVAMAISLSLLAVGCSGTAADDPAADGATTGDTATDGGQPAAELTRVNYFSPFGLSASFVAAYVAKEQGYWEDLGLDVSLLGGRGTSTAMQALLSGSADFIQMGASSFPAIIEDDAPLVYFMQEQRYTPYVVASLPEAEIESIDDLEGKTVGVVSTGGTSETTLRMMLRGAGIDPDTMEFPVTGSGAAPLPLAKAGDVDAWIGNIRDVSLMQKDGEELNIIRARDHVIFPSNTFVTSREILEQDRDMVVDFAVGILKAMEFARDEANWDAVVAAAQSVNPQLESDDVRHQLELRVENWYADGDENVGNIVPEEWQQFQEQLVDAGQLEETVDLERVAAPEIVAEAKERLASQ